MKKITSIITLIVTFPFLFLMDLIVPSTCDGKAPCKWNKCYCEKIKVGTVVYFRDGREATVLAIKGKKVTVREKTTVYEEPLKNLYIDRKKCPDLPKKPEPIPCAVCGKNIWNDEPDYGAGIYYVRSGSVQTEGKSFCSYSACYESSKKK